MAVASMKLCVYGCSQHEGVTMAVASMKLCVYGFSQHEVVCLWL